MYQAKWNYTEDVEYKVVLVRLLPIPGTPCHWQNAFAGENRQAVWIKRGDDTFMIDNQDGTGILKLEHGGGPDSYHASIGAHEYICDVQPDYWVQYRKELADKYRDQYDAWMEEHYPEKLKEIKALQKVLREGLMHIAADGKFKQGERPRQQKNSSEPKA